jgi:hypothetical protein
LCVRTIPQQHQQAVFQLLGTRQDSRTLIVVHVKRSFWKADFSGLGIRNLLDGNGECSGVDGRAASSGDGEGVGSGGGVEGLGTGGPAIAGGTSAGDDGD